MQLSFWTGFFIEIIVIILVFFNLKRITIVVNGQPIPNPRISTIICIVHVIGLGIMSFYSINYNQGIFGQHIFESFSLNYWIGWVIGFCAFGAFVEARKPYPLAPYDFKP